MSVDPVKEWVLKAEEDWEAIQRLLKTGKVGSVADVIVFLCQQMAEKYLKATLVQMDREPPYTHNLGMLLDLAAESAPELETIRDDAERLSPFAITFRYPGEWATEGETHQAVTMARHIREALRRHLMLQ